MLKLSTRAAEASERSKINGAVYPPLDVCNAVQAVAIKEAAIRLKLLMLRLAAKYF